MKRLAICLDSGGCVFATFNTTEDCSAVIDNWEKHVRQCLEEQRSPLTMSYFYGGSTWAVLACRVIGMYILPDETPQERLARASEETAKAVTKVAEDGEDWKG